MTEITGSQGALLNRPDHIESGSAKVARLQSEAAARHIEAQQLAKTFNESTDASWFWALLFGPIYFAVHGFWGRALIILLLNFFIIGFIVAPFLAYPAWRGRALKKADQILLLDAVRSR